MGRVGKASHRSLLRSAEGKCRHLPARCTKQHVWVGRWRDGEMEILHYRDYSSFVEKKAHRYILSGAESPCTETAHCGIQFIAFEGWVNETKCVGGEMERWRFFIIVIIARSLKKRRIVTSCRGQSRLARRPPTVEYSSSLSRAESASLPTVLETRHEYRNTDTCNEMINQSINQPTNQPSNESTTRPIKKPTDLPTGFCPQISSTPLAAGQGIPWGDPPWEGTPQGIPIGDPLRASPSGDSPR